MQVHGLSVIMPLALKKERLTAHVKIFNSKSRYFYPPKALAVEKPNDGFRPRIALGRQKGPKPAENPRPSTDCVCELV